MNNCKLGLAHLDFVDNTKTSFRFKKSGFDPFLLQCKNMCRM